MDPQHGLWQEVAVTTTCHTLPKWVIWGQILMSGGRIDHGHHEIQGLVPQNDRFEDPFLDPF